MEIIMLGIDVILIVLIWKYPKLQKVKLFLERLFWIDKFNGEGFHRKLLRFYGKCGMIFYLLFIIWGILYWLITFEFSVLINVIFFGGIGFLLCYRIVVGFQRYLHNI
jgi:hypothetical protein